MFKRKLMLEINCWVISKMKDSRKVSIANKGSKKDPMKNRNERAKYEEKELKNHYKNQLILNNKISKYT